MNRNSKKGFTIVELVIVIAVIAILAAVLIPTFAGLINKANQSADQQAVTNMNKILATETKADNLSGVIEILSKNNYADVLTTYYKGYALAWVSSENVIVLLDSDNSIVFPKAYAGKTLAYDLINPEFLASGLVNGTTVTLTGNVAVTDGIVPETSGEYSIDLNGKTLTSSYYVGSWVDGADIAISNGIIDGTSSTTSIIVYAEAGVNVELEDVQIYAASGTNPIQCYGATMVLNNVTTAQYGQAETSWYNSAIQVINMIENVDGSWKYTGNAAHLTIDGGMYSGDKAIQVSAPGATVVINGGTFIGTTAAINADYSASYAGQGAQYSITINGGSFTGAIDVDNGYDFVINGGTFTVNVETLYPNAIGAGKTVVDNGNGTWTVQ